MFFLVWSFVNFGASQHRYDCLSWFMYEGQGVCRFCWIYFAVFKELSNRLEEKSSVQNWLTAAASLSFTFYVLETVCLNTQYFVTSAVGLIRDLWISQSAWMNKKSPHLSSSFFLSALLISMTQTKLAYLGEARYYSNAMTRSARWGGGCCTKSTRRGQAWRESARRLFADLPNVWKKKKKFKNKPLALPFKGPPQSVVHFSTLADWIWKWC